MAEQTIRFSAEGGRRIAWTQTGTGPPLVFSGWWMSHLELNWRDPRIRAYIEALGRHRTVIRYDLPGTGLSADGNLPGGDLEEETAALAAVIEAAGGGPVDLFAGSSGVPIAVAYAAAHPELVGQLVLYGGYASGPRIVDERTRKAILHLVGEHWGLGSRALADVFIPSATAQERAEFVEFQRRATSPERAVRSLEAVYRFDVSDRLGEVAPGAVVMHRRDDRAIRFELGRELAAGLPEATFVALEGHDHFLWFGDVDQVLGASLGALGVSAGSQREGQRPPEAGELTKRETEVLGLIAKGLSNREIADRLVLSPHTVHRHVANILTKLGLPTRAAAVAAAAKRGLL